jgi:hypothetical protein
MEEKNFSFDEWSDSSSKEMNLIKNIMAKPPVKLEQKDITKEPILPDKEKSVSFKDLLGIL